MNTGNTGSLCWPGTGKADSASVKPIFHAALQCSILNLAGGVPQSGAVALCDVIKGEFVEINFPESRGGEANERGMAFSHFWAIHRPSKGTNSWGSLHKVSVKWAPLMLWAKLLNWRANKHNPIDVCLQTQSHKHACKRWHTRRITSRVPVQDQEPEQEPLHPDSILTVSMVTKPWGSRVLKEQCAWAVVQEGYPVLDSLRDSMVTSSLSPPPSRQSDFTLGFSTVAETQKVQGKIGSRQQTLHLCQRPVGPQRLDTASGSVWMGVWISAKFPVCKWREMVLLRQLGEKKWDYSQKLSTLKSDYNNIHSLFLRYFSSRLKSETWC